MTLDILCDTDEAVARCREDTHLEDGDENESDPEDPKGSGDPREPEQLTGRVPCIHRLLFAIIRQPTTPYSVYWNCSIQIMVLREGVRHGT